MPTTKDFRLALFSPENLNKSAVYLGRQTYSKLYAIENIFRVIVHSVLSVQISSKSWWETAVDETMRGKAEKFRIAYLKKAWHSNPGAHGIYYLDLKDLGEILRVNANLFDPIVPEIDKWVLGIEELRLPRNIVAHMNFPNKTDIQRINVFYDDCTKLLALIQDKLALTTP